MNPARRTKTAVATALVLTTAGGLLTAAAGSASAATTCTSPVYKRQFFANTTFSGTAKKTDCDSVIDQNWGTKAPASGLPTNNFGVRWTVTRDFGSGGPFALPVAAQDGIRVYLDGTRKVDIWKNVSTTVKKTVNITIPKGKHTLRIDYVNWTGTANVKFAYTPRTTATVDKVKPLAPTGAQVVFDAEDNTVRGILSWSANKEMDLAGYRVYRRVKGTSSWTKVTTTTSRGYTDFPPATGQSYLYEVRAYDKAGNESVGSADQGPITTDDNTPPAAPVLTAVGVEASNNLTWTASAEAVTYRVSRKRDIETSYTQLAETTSTGYTDTTAAYTRTYDYKVSAIDAAGNAAASAVVRSKRSITPPANVVATVPSWGVVFTWTEPAGGDTAEYRVYRSETSPVDLETATLVDCLGRHTSVDSSGSTTRTCTDGDGDQGVTYHYVMTRKNTAGLWSVGSREMTLTRPGDEIPPPALAGLTAEPLEYGVKLDWDDSTAVDLDEYWIYERPTKWDVPEILAVVDAGTSEYLVGPERADGESTQYVVVAVDVYGNSLTYEDEPDIEDWLLPVATAAVTELDLTPTVTLDDSAPCHLSNWTGSAGSILAVECDESVAATAAGINVYRWDPAAVAYVRLTDLPLAASTTRYTDTTTPTGTTNHYVISVVAADGSETFSNVDYNVYLPSGA
ncbi:fibronectin type III domain-containing protein [Streptomyces sp. NBC_00038]|uniref:fibronectin type III domain-containing protein n=1 Tax=Streptomyces sp. NBC_00038 TaxID=2903615 RepID=UPI00225017E5|nr:PA14 domain-containing protein [Streptomyces sp. NBC_00038]MCX5559330.1 PA14 domain-containing protein [Streptomyces sp. NBC_00038]